MKAILPGAFQGAVIGSLVVAAYFTINGAVKASEISGPDLVSGVMLFCFVLMIGTLAGMIVCAVYIAVVGLPLALLMRRRIATQAMLIVTVLVALAMGLATSWFVMTPLWGASEDAWLVTVMVLCYAVPTGLAYRRAIITERMLSFWTTDTD
ncbi:MAG: hypothetical protein AAF291_02285 [Pseudomonadota bacterium]